MKEDWIECTFKEITISLKRGPFGGDLKKAFFVKSGFPVYEQQHAINDDYSNIRYFIDDERFDKLKACNVGPGDYIVSCSGTMGKISRLPNKSVFGVINQALLRIRLNEEIMHHNYFIQFFRSSIFQKKILKDSRGSGMQNMAGIKELKPITIAVPTLVEQKAIVKKIEGLFSSLDSGIADLQKAQAQLKIYRQAVLKKAFEGELTKEWRTKQTKLPTADELLEQIKEEFEILVLDKKKKKEKSLLPIKKEDIPHKIPVGWKWCNLGEITWFINGDRGKNYPNRSEYVASGIPWINTGHIKPDGTLSSEKMNYISREKFNSLRSGKIKEGDLVYCLRGATFGKTAYVMPYKEGSIASSLMIIRSNDRLNNIYLYHFLTSVEGKKQLQRFDNGTAQPNLSASMVRSYAFPLPSTKEQQQIVKEIESRLSVCDAVEKSIAESLAKATALRQSILKKAFEGKLLGAAEIAECKAHKDYEPASVLLERIREEKKGKVKDKLKK